jgi:hypothetical protein
MEAAASHSRLPRRLPTSGTFERRSMRVCAGAPTASHQAEPGTVLQAGDQPAHTTEPGQHPSDLLGQQYG